MYKQKQPLSTMTQTGLWGRGCAERSPCRFTYSEKTRLKTTGGQGGRCRKSGNKRNNLRILGLPEGAEGSDPVAFMEHLLPSLSPRLNSPHTSSLSGPTTCQQLEAHRGPCTFIFKLLHYQDRDTVLPAAHIQGELKFDNTKLQIFPDYSVETQILRPCSCYVAGEGGQVQLDFSC